MKSAHKHRILAVGALLATSAITFVACANPPEEIRQNLRSKTGIKITDEDGRSEAIRESIAILNQEDPRGETSTLRWQAAQNLGQLGALEAYDLLWSRAFSSLLDKNATVRRECVIALSKLPYPSSRDPQRLALIAKFRSRLAFERSESFYRQLLERDTSVRMAMVEGLITLGLPPNHGNDALAIRNTTGDRTCADALATLLSALSSETTDKINYADIGTPTRFTQGMIDTCIRGLMVLTSTDEVSATAARRALKPAEYTSWWSERIAAMPSNQW